MIKFIQVLDAANQVVGTFEANNYTVDKEGLLTIVSKDGKKTFAKGAYAGIMLLHKLPAEHKAGA